MTRHLVLLGGSAEDACTYLQSFEDSGLTVEHRLEPDDLAQRSVDVLVTLDRRMIEWMADRSSRPTTIKSWVAIIEAGDRSAVKLARSAGVNGLILRGASPRQAKTQILRVRDQLQLSEQQERLKRRLSQGAGHTNRWVARSEAMRAAGAMIGRVAPLRIPLLIHGETGSGRSHLAQLIHESGPRSTGPMITLDCGSMDPARVGAKLFGKEPGAFANDEAESEGAISAAENGTLVLEDIAAMTEQVQTMLLEYLQTGTYRRVGAEQTDRADVRIIAIADKSLEERLHEKGFRLDLFQTLQGLRISLPPLRERRDDVLPLAMPGMMTGGILGMARALGESAPLLLIGMVAFIVDVPRRLTDPSTVLPVQVYLWARSSERAFVERTSGAIIVLLVFLMDTPNLTCSDTYVCA